MYYLLIVAGGEEEAKQEVARRFPGAVITRTVDLSNAGRRPDTSVRIKSTPDITNELNEWFIEERTPPYKTGDLLYWRPVPATEKDMIV